MTKPSSPLEGSAAERVAALTPENPYRSSGRKPRLLIVGAGMMGREHLRVSQLLGWADVQGIVDPDGGSLEWACSDWRLLTNAPLTIYRDLNEACLDEAVDAIVIATPNHTHRDVLHAVASSHKPVLLEKPMATTLADAMDIVNLARGYPAVIQLGMQYRFKAQYVEALQAVTAQSALGEVKTVAMSEYRPPFLDKVNQWNKFNRNSGGTLVEKCCHYFDLINVVAQSRPRRVYASGDQAVNFLDFEQGGESADIDDHAFVVIDYDNGIRGNFTLNMFCHDFTEEMVICGDRGRLVTREIFNIHQQKPSSATVALELGEFGGSKHTEVTYAREIESSGHHGATYYEHIAFVDQLEGNLSTSATPLQGLWSIIIACAAQQSIATGEAVYIDQFLADNKLSEFSK